jgi:hypothetical protein
MSLSQTYPTYSRTHDQGLGCDPTIVCDQAQALSAPPPLLDVSTKCGMSSYGHSASDDIADGIVDK